ncbi:hypothetical protein BKH42_08505 [Helicobacter sp. 13S00482-2]|uniref:hypothetical protein n=1 Tax=Helicobacter sp. 13S00482-2 TaxID=1476200 RepID=UPI000BA7246C|nr:hypothetical protein [Helicobacter sp. 13S00482-2]PAF52969.1 hypothetical protein BKH42_08505 [Helicobacter sp. 13S00482-2]
MELKYPLCKVYQNHIAKNNYMGEFIPLFETDSLDTAKSSIKFSLNNFLKMKRLYQGYFILIVKFEKMTLMFEATFNRKHIIDMNLIG